MCNIKERKNPTDFSMNLVLTSLVLLPNHKCVQYCFQATNDFSTVSKPPMSLVLPFKPPISSILPPNHRCLQYSFKNTYLLSIAFKPPMSSVFPPGHNGFQNSIEATDFFVYDRQTTNVLTSTPPMSAASKLPKPPRK